MYAPVVCWPRETAQPVTVTSVNAIAAAVKVVRIFMCVSRNRSKTQL
jgi:hypothetical protein